jgi:poly(3-hydroxybutyrate) depolymerase/protein-S-isoprenylcysteine O-methyltransferase Ste14
MLIALFAIQHSVMARHWFKRWWTRLVPAHLERSTYVLISSGVTLWLCVAWHPIPQAVWSAESIGSLILWWSAFAFGLLVLFVASFQIDHWELLGLRQTWVRLREIDSDTPSFTVRGLYRLVRHPIYLGWLLLFWIAPHMTIGHLLLAVGMTAYTLLAIRFEERDLIRAHGEQYVDYRGRIPALVPRPSRAFRVSALVLVMVFAGIVAADRLHAQGAIDHLTLLSGGRERSATVVAPNDEHAPKRLVIMLHGAGGNADRIREFTARGLERHAVVDGWVVAYPEGVQGTWNDCRMSPPYAAKQLAVDDVGYLAELIEQLASRYGLAPENTIVAGFSNGGQMAIRLAMERPNLVGTLAVLAAQLPTPDESSCDTEIPALRSLWMGGTKDPFIPLRGGPSVGLGGDNLGKVLSLSETVRTFASAIRGASALDTRTLPEMDGDASTWVTRTDYWEPSKGTVAELVLLHGSGHVVPQREFRLPAQAGPAAGDIDFAEVLAEFLESGRIDSG